MLHIADDAITARVGYPIQDAATLARGLIAMAQTAAAVAKVAPVHAGPYRS